MVYREKIPQSWLYPKIICKLDATISAPWTALIVCINLCKSENSDAYQYAKKKKSVKYDLREWNITRTPDAAWIGNTSSEIQMKNICTIQEKLPHGSQEFAVMRSHL